MFASILTRYWWMTLLRGVIAILFGILLLAEPGLSVAALTLTFGVFVLIDGVAALAMAFGGRHENENWSLLLLAGLAGLVMGVMTFVSPGVTALALLFYMAIWSIATGMLAIVAAIRLREEIKGELWLGLGGVLSIAFGVAIASRPGAGAIAILWVIGTYAVIFGVTLVLLAFKVRSFANRIGTASTTGTVED